MNALTLPDAEQDFIRQAVQYLERPNLLSRVSEVIGKPAEYITQKLLPDKVKEIVHTSLQKAVNMAADTVRTTPTTGDRDFASASSSAGRTGIGHLIATTAAGAASGLFGLAGLAVELPLTTGLMLRSMVAIAAEFGEDVSDPAVRLECLALFGQGGPSSADDANESSYLTARLGLAALLTEAAVFVGTTAGRALAESAALGATPIMLRLIGQVAARYNIAVSQKVVAQSLPLLGAGTGALLNAAFTDHFNKVARFHFGLRKLERRYGAEAIEARYREELRSLPLIGPPVGPGGPPMVDAQG